VNTASGATEAAQTVDNLQFFGWSAPRCEMEGPRP
jgi:hypothetical protein